MIEVGEWIHIEPSKLSVVRINPTQLNEYKNRVQEPFFNLVLEGKRELVVNGRAMFWSLLDALFPYDKLPRIPVNNALQGNPIEFVHDLNSFFQESTVPYISIMVGTVLDPLSTVGKESENPGAVIITANSGLKAPDCVEIADRYNGLIVPGTWVDNKGKYEVPCVVIENCVHIHDLGQKLVVGSVLKTQYGENVRPIPHEVVKKSVSWPSVLASTIQRHIEAAEAASSRIYPPPNAWIHISDRTSEVMSNEHRAFLRGHQE